MQQKTILTTKLTAELKETETQNTIFKKSINPGAVINKVVKLLEGFPLKFFCVQ